MATARQAGIWDADNVPVYVPTRANQPRCRCGQLMRVEQEEWSAYLRWVCWMCGREGPTFRLPDAR